MVSLISDVSFWWFRFVVSSFVKYCFAYFTSHWPALYSDLLCYFFACLFWLSAVFYTAVFLLKQRRKHAIWMRARKLVKLINEWLVSCELSTNATTKKYLSRNTRKRSEPMSKFAEMILISVGKTFKFFWFHSRINAFFRILGI